MKIAMVDFVVEPDKPGEKGLSDVVWCWATQLRQLGEEVHIIAPYTSENYPDKDVIVHRFKVPPGGYRNIIGHTLIILRAWRELRKLKNVDIIHLPEYHSSAIIGLLEREIPVVLTTPGNIYERIQHGNPYDRITTQVLKIAAKISVKRCKHIIAISNDMKKWWEFTGAESSKITVIPNGVDTQFFKPHPNSREILGLDENLKIILYAGRLSHEKGVKDLLEATNNIKNEFENLQLYIIGEGSEEENLKEHARLLKLDNIVRFKGWLSKQDLIYFYSAADVFVLPSFSEGMPRTMIEPMACKTPFIGTTITGVVDHITDGENGLSYSPGDIDTLTLKLGKILRDDTLREKITTNAYEYVQENLTWEIVVKRIKKEVYEAITK